MIGEAYGVAPINWQRSKVGGRQKLDRVRNADLRGDFWDLEGIMRVGLRFYPKTVGVTRREVRSKILRMQME